MKSKINALATRIGALIKDDEVSPPFTKDEAFEDALEVLDGLGCGMSTEVLEMAKTLQTTPDANYMEVDSVVLNAFDINAIASYIAELKVLVDRLPNQ